MNYYNESSWNGSSFVAGNDSWEAAAAVGGDVDPAVVDVEDQEQINVVNLIWTISFTVIVVVGTCGNGIVLWIILGELILVYIRTSA